MSPSTELYCLMKPFIISYTPCVLFETLIVSSLSVIPLKVNVTPLTVALLLEDVKSTPFKVYFASVAATKVILFDADATTPSKAAPVICCNPKFSSGLLPPTAAFESAEICSSELFSSFIAALLTLSIS